MTAEPTGAPRDPSARVTIDLHLDPDDEQQARRELRQALLESPRRIPSRFFYDDRGSELFERICELPEYYPTRTEAGILAARADEIVLASGARELVELGSGAAVKTRILLDALARAGRLDLYVPMDVSEGTVRRSAAELARSYPGMRVHGIVGDFLRHLDEIPDGGRRLVIFLGGTIGNFHPDDAVGFLRSVHQGMRPGDMLLLGTDLVKDPARLEAAYDDAQGVTAEFNLNVLSVVNRLVYGDFDPAGFRHRAFFDRQAKWIEMRLVSEREQTVRLPAIDLAFELGAGEEILTEISAKYDRPRVEALLSRSGYELLAWYTDPEELFALSLSRRV